jgi:excisionase family DNA binding protein
MEAEGKLPATHQAEPLAVDAPRAARRLGIGTRALWSLTAAGKIPHVRIGRRVLYRVAALEAWLIEQEQKGRGPRVAGAARASARPAAVHSTGGEA